MSRTKKKPYSGAKAVDPTCRSHGSCPWCEGGRKHKNEKRKPVDGFVVDFGIHDPQSAVDKMDVYAHQLGTFCG